MKRIFVILLTCLAMTACTPQQDSTLPNSTAVPETIPVTIPAETETTEAPTEAHAVSLTLYIPNDNADGFVETKIEVEAVNESILLEKLVDYGALPEGIMINSLEAAEEVLYIDFNTAFRDHLITQGTAGENMLIGSVVTTFANAYDMKSVMLTVDGGVLESGHVVYDFPIAVIP